MSQCNQEELVDGLGHGPRECTMGIEEEGGTVCGWMRGVYPHGGALSISHHQQGAGRISSQCAVGVAPSSMGKGWLASMKRCLSCSGRVPGNRRGSAGMDLSQETRELSSWPCSPGRFREHVQQKERPSEGAVCEGSPTWLFSVAWGWCWGSCQGTRLPGVGRGDGVLGQQRPGMTSGRRRQSGPNCCSRQQGYSGNQGAAICRLCGPWCSWSAACKKLL